MLEGLVDPVSQAYPVKPVGQLMSGVPLGPAGPTFSVAPVVPTDPDITFHNESSMTIYGI